MTDISTHAHFTPYVLIRWEAYRIPSREDARLYFAGIWKAIGLGTVH